MAQDFGSGLLAGFQGASAMAQQRRDTAARDRQLSQRDAELTQRKIEFEESIRQFDKSYDLDERATLVAEGVEGRAATEFDIGLRANEADALINIAGNGGYFTPGKLNLATESLAQGLSSGETGAKRLALASANRQNKIPGFEFTNLRALEDGSLVVEGEYEDGRSGVATENGTDDPADPVLTFTPERLAKLISDDFIITANESSVLGGAKGLSYLAMSGANDADIANINRLRSAQTTVVNAVEETGNVGLTRQFKGVLAAAESDAEKLAILEDQAAAMGIELPKMQAEGTLVDYTPTGRLTTAGPPVTDRKGQSSARRVTQARRAGISRLDTNIANLESKLATAKSDAERDNIQSQLSDLDGERSGLVTNENKSNLDLVNTEITDLQSKFDKAAPARKEYWQERLDEKKSVRVQLEEALGIRTPIMGSEAYKQLESQVFSRLDAMTSEQVDQAVDSGELTFTPESIQVMRQRLQEANVTSTQDLTNLPSTEQLAYRALLAVIAPDQSARDQFREEMSNLKETSTLSLSAEEAGKQAVDMGTLNTRIAELRRNLRNDTYNTAEDIQERLDSASDLSANFVQQTNAIFFGEDGSERNLDAKAARRYSRQILPQILTTAARSASPQEAQLFQAALNTGVSLTMAGYAAEEEGGFGETFYSFFRPDSVDVAAGTDFDLARVRLDGTPENPEAFYYVSADGRRTDERVLATDLQDLDDKVYAIVLDAAKKNSAAARRQ